MKRLNTDEARRALSATPAAATASTEQRGSWVVTPAIDMARPFKVVVTQAKTRMDSHLAAGDGVIAFGTGSNKGVAFLRVGATGEESIPDGSSYSSKAFAVCGKKIVLTRDQQVFVYDTQSGQTAEVPAGEINLARGGDPSRKLQADGNLVITVNDPKKVDDRVVVKVIDVSGAAPRVIPIKNAGLTSQDITSVAIDAETGKLVIGSKRKKAIYVADVAPKAEPKGLDLSGHDGFGDYPMLLSGGFAYYADGSGSPKFRMVDLAGSQVVTTGDWGTKAFAASGQHYAFEHDAPASGPDQFVIGTAPAAPQQPANSGGSIPDCNGKFGQGTSVAVAPSGAVFVAGDKGLGSGEFLHASTGGDWVAIRGADGKPIPATDVTMGDYVLAFRTGARNDTMVAYATFGAKITLPGGQQ